MSTAPTFYKKGKITVMKKEPEINERGNIIIRRFRHVDRYAYDYKLCTKRKGWKQYDTTEDAWYFGIWVHAERRIIITYAEGDVTIVRCPTEDSYHAELKSMADFYGAPPPAWIVIDSETGKRTDIYDERPA